MFEILNEQREADVIRAYENDRPIRLAWYGGDDLHVKLPGDDVSGALLIGDATDDQRFQIAEECYRKRNADADWDGPEYHACRDFPDCPDRVVEPAPEWVYLGY